MKICFVIGNLTYSGAEKIARGIIEGLCEKHDISVILMACTEKEYSINRIREYPLYIPVDTNRCPFSRVYKRIKIMHKIIIEQQFDLVVSFGVQYNLDTVLATFCTKTKAILCERNDPVYDPQNRLGRIRRALTYRFANGYVFQTEVIKSFFSKDIQRKSTVIPNYITDIGIKYNPTQKSIVSCARLDDFQKDFSTLISAFNIIHRKYPNYTLDLYGDGPDKELLKQIVTKYELTDFVNFWGRVNNPNKMYSHCDFFVLPSRFEGMPNALMEAMSIGMPCISSDCSGGGARALIQDGVNGYLYPVGDVNSLSSLIELLIKDQEKKKVIGTNAYNINVTHSFPKILNQWEDYFSDVVGLKKSI